MEAKETEDKIRNIVTIDRAITLLNEILELDSKALHSLINSRVSCNKELANHPTIQVNEFHQVGLLGVLNGLFGIDKNGWGGICMVVTKEGKIEGFKRTHEVDDDIPKIFQNKNNK